MKKTLLEIQREIHELDEQVKSISTSISQIYMEIDKLRNDKIDSIDYATIQIMSRRFSFGKHPLSRLNNIYARQIYLKILLNLVQIDCGSPYTVNRLIFVQWILLQSKLNISLEKLFKDSLKMNACLLEELVEHVPERYIKYLIMDALLTANICGKADHDVLIYIANLCSILGVEKEHLRILSIMASGILKQKFGKMKRGDLQQVLEQVKEFRYYINEDFFEESIKSQRTIVVKVADEICSNFKWKVKQQEQVKKGNIIATYCQRRGGEKAMVKITAPCDGTLFQFRKEYVNYGVIAHEMDNKDAIKAWTLQRR